MIDTFEIYQELKARFDVESAEALTRILSKIYEDIQNTVTRQDFSQLQEVVRDLAEAQKRTEERLNDLAEAQKRTEERLNDLAEAQKRTEERLESFEQATEENFRRVWQAIEGLSEAQKRTEERLESFEQATEENFRRVWQAIEGLSEAQKRTEERLNDLAEAQKKTEEELRKLVGEHRKTREQVGSLAHTVGYVLEDRAYKGLPELLKRDFGLQIVDGLRRDYIKIGTDKYEEINIIGKAKRDGKDVWVIGECKSQLKKVDVDDFLKAVKKIEPFVRGERVLVAVTYQASPAVREYVEQKGIKLYFSFEMPLS